MPYNITAAALKPLGITVFAWVAATLRLASPPPGTAWKQIFGASCLPFGEGLDIAKIGVLGASAVAEIAGVMTLRRSD